MTTMTKKLTFTRGTDGKPKFSDADFAGVAAFARTGPGLSLRVPKEFRDAAVEELMRQIRVAQFSREGVTFEQAAAFVRQQRRDLSFIDRLPILLEGESRLDIELVEDTARG
jgi:hypothetical protein